MPNRRWNDIHKDDKMDSENGARGKGKDKTTRNTYGGSVSFKSGFSDPDSDLQGIETSHSPQKVGSFKSLKNQHKVNH